MAQAAEPAAIVTILKEATERPLVCILGPFVLAPARARSLKRTGTAGLGASNQAFETVTAQSRLGASAYNPGQMDVPSTTWVRVSAKLHC